MNFFGGGGGGFPGGFPGMGGMGEATCTRTSPKSTASIMKMPNFQNCQIRSNQAMRSFDGGLLPNMPRLCV